MYQPTNTMFGSFGGNFQEQASQQEFLNVLASYEDLYNESSYTCLFKWPIFVAPTEVS
jgi:hypothetical protein